MNRRYEHSCNYPSPVYRLSVMENFLKPHEKITLCRKVLQGALQHLGDQFNLIVSDGQANYTLQSDHKCST
jgi:hypothetical protein